jgi:hypothetical protein
MSGQNDDALKGCVTLLLLAVVMPIGYWIGVKIPNDREQAAYEQRKTLYEQQQRADAYNTEEIRMRCQRCGKVVWRLRKDREKAEDLLVDCLTGEVSVGGIPRPHIFAPE